MGGVRQGHGEIEEGPPSPGSRLLCGLKVRLAPTQCKTKVTSTVDSSNLTAVMQLTSEGLHQPADHEKNPLRWGVTDTEGVKALSPLDKRGQLQKTVGQTPAKQTPRKEPSSSTSYWGVPQYVLNAPKGPMLGAIFRDSGMVGFGKMGRIKGPSEIGQQRECCSLQQMIRPGSVGAVCGAK